MNKEALKLKLDLLGVNPIQYSLNGELKLDSIILFYSNTVWEVFYQDERGGKNDQKRFASESDACEYIFKIFKDAKAIESKFGIKT